MHALLTSLLVGAWPAFVPGPPSVKVASTITETNYDALKLVEGGKEKLVQGHHWQAYFEFVPEGSNVEPGPLWAQWKPVLEKQGWAVVGSSSEERQQFLKRVEGKKEFRLSVSMGSYVQPQVEVVEVGGQPTKLDLKPPAKKATTIGERDDFPFATKFPGATLTSTATAETPFMAIDDRGDSQLIAEASSCKAYKPPSTLSRLETMRSYGDALKKVGWVLTNEATVDNRLIAHFAKEGRDVWLSVARAADDSDQGLSLCAVDVGADDLAKRLDKDCRVELTGVRFDFDKATLKPDSAGVLDRAVAALKSRPALKLEVQGHTDNVGDDAYNQKLSGARAEAVMAYLTKAGVKAANLSAKGYGKSQPISDNDTELGRAKNRRVELRCSK